MGDQPRAIDELVTGVNRGDPTQVLLGITGSGKTFTMAQNVIAQIQRPTLIIAHNKTLAAQLYGEFKELFPDNAVHYFVSYYDYYQPEAYVPSTDTYIEKDSIDQRGDRSDAPRGDATRCSSRPRRDHRRVGVVHLRHRRRRGVPGHDAASSTKGRRGAARRRAAPAGRDPVRAQRRRLPPRHVPRARRHRRDLPGLRGARRRSASSGSATRSRRSPRSIRCAARCCASSTRSSIFPGSHYVTPADTAARAR